MTKSISRMALAASLFLGVAAPAAQADILPNGSGAHLCKGKSSCNTLKAACKGKGTYTPGPSDGPYGKCQWNSAAGRKLTIAPVSPPPRIGGLRAR